MKRIVLASAAAVLGSVDQLAGQVCGIERVSVHVSGNEAPYASSVATLSGNGRYVLFSTQSGLVPRDMNRPIVDVYLFDTQSGQLELISVGLSGFAANKSSTHAGSISEDGRYVAFTSFASDLVPGDTSDSDAFLRDRWTGTTTLVSTNANGGGNGDAWGLVRLSPDGRYVLFTSSKKLVYYDTNAFLQDVYLRDLQSGALECVSVTPAGVTGFGPGDASWGQTTGISNDGRYVVFATAARYVAPGDSQDRADVFRRDRWTGMTTVLSVNASGQPGNHHSTWPTCSDDGRWVAFQSWASDLVAGDTNGQPDIFLCDADTGLIERISLSSIGAECALASYGCQISPDGRFVAFASACSELVLGDTNFLDDIFLHDRTARRTERVSNAQFGQPNGTSTWPGVSRHAGLVSFASIADNLIPVDGNQEWDIFVRRCALPESYCIPKLNSQGCSPDMGSIGIPMVVTPTGFVLTAVHVLNQKSGRLFYSTAGAASVPFQGGTLCVQAPVRGTTAQSSGGTPAGTDCTGSYAFDFNAWIASGLDPALSAGASVWAQYWSRDPGFPAPDNSGLTNATRFVIWP